ncbi:MULTISPECIES: YozE family protein [Psychrobacillus]|uniref:YozE family protein n=1 Tax=Psychrobacillus faecigallinarum TaxID=2762235 RepID=A0ABR8R969_9BACI|nr:MULTISPECIES: YozE family protein [Psychrobacillus]MBD7944344.1 YozE family protein [Psychrobacillus faecigallinarum]QEY19740.1 YozE family protein [Psychrobacillus sp. AK 1817]QGM30278.1 YozE family protein [Bacillus sp. N3536]
MHQSFYLFALKFRGGQKNDAKAQFAEHMFLQHDFPKAETSFQEISEYIEELAHPEMTAIVFDEIWGLYEDHIR